MKVTIHQPTYLPYLGFFAKVRSADAFIVYDTAQYEKGSVHNRQQIRTAQGSTWLTIPLAESLTPFKDTSISYANEKRPWFEIHWRTVELNYKKTAFFPKYKDELFGLFHYGHPKTLAEFNIGFINFFLRVSQLSRRVFLFSELDIEKSLSASEKLAVAAEKLNADEYISGPSGRHYLETEPFDKRGIDVSFFQWEHPEYPQFHSKYDGKFLPNMAALDALMNLGYLPMGGENGELQDGLRASPSESLPLSSMEIREER